MSLGPIPVVAVGTLSGPRPTGAGARTPGAPAQSPGSLFSPVGLDQSSAVSGLTLTPYSSPRITADTPQAGSFAQQLLLVEAQAQI